MNGGERGDAAGCVTAGGSSAHDAAGGASG